MTQIGPATSDSEIVEVEEAIFAKLPGDVRGFHRFITDYARSVGQPVDRIQRAIAVRAIATMLDGLRDENGEVRLAYKGGAALELRLGFGARLSGDLDGAFRGDLDEMRRLIEEELKGGWRAFTGTVSEPLPINRARVTPTPLRMDMKILYLGKPFKTVPFEVSAAEGRTFESLEEIAPDVYVAGEARVTVIGISRQIAQKVHACTEPESEGEENSAPVTCGT